MATVKNSKEVYRNKASVLKTQYSRFMDEYQKASDDRRLAYNIYRQLLDGCVAMEPVDSSIIHVAFNNYVKAEKQQIDEIILRFEGLKYDDTIGGTYSWVPASNARLNSLNEAYDLPENETGFVYWTNACGEVNLPSDFDGDKTTLCIHSEDELPSKQHMLYNLLQPQSGNALEYLISYQNQTGIAFCFLFDKDWQAGLGLTTEKTKSIIENLIFDKFAKDPLYEKCLFFYGENTDPDGDEFIVFVPYEAFKQNKDDDSIEHMTHALYPYSKTIEAIRSQLNAYYLVEEAQTPILRGEAQ